MLSMKNALQVLVGATLFFLAEYTIYSFTKMAGVLYEGSMASVIAYKFLWLMILTVAIGLSAPLGALIGALLKRSGAAWISAGTFVGIIMVAFTALSYLEVLSKIDKGDIPSTTSGVPKPASRVAELIEFVEAKAVQADSDTIRVDVTFKNLSDFEFNEVDYNFIAVDDGVIFYRIYMRDALYIPPKLSAVTSLTWKRSALEDPKLYDAFQEALTKGTLRVFAKPERVVRLDGRVIEDKRA